MSSASDANILLVDDNETNRYTIGRYLRRAHYSVWEASNGAQALSLARQMPDLIVLDVRLPDMLGYEVSRILKADPITALIPILHISATFTTAASRVEGLEHGADAFLTEPVDPDELLANVKVLLRLYRTQAALQASNAKLQSVLSSITEAYVVLDSDWRFCQLNPAAEQLLGRSGADLAGKSIWEEFPQAVGATCHDKLLQAVKHNESLHFETDSRLAGRWLEFHAYPRENHLELYLRDISERKDAENSVRQNRQFLTEVVELSPALIIATGLDGTIQLFNKACEKLTGYRRDEVIGKNIFDILIPPEWASAVRERYATLSVADLGQPHLNTWRVKSGELRLIEWRCNRFGAQSGEASFMLGTGIDLTESRRAEEALRESESRFRAMAETVPDFLFTTLADGKADYVNQRFFDFTGLSAESAAGHGWLTAVHPEDRDRVLSEWNQAVISGVPFETEYQMRDHTGSYRWFMSRARPIRDKEGQVVKWFGACVDIHDLKLAHSEISNLNRHLEHRVRERTAKLEEAVQELETISYSIVHDMRAPLRSMHGFAEALLEDYAHRLDASGADYLERIINSSKRLDLLIRDVLTYSRVITSEPKLHPVDLNNVISAILHDYPHFGPANAKITVAPLPVVMGSEILLTQTLANLLDNAIKFAKPGTVPAIRVRAEEREDHVRIWVEDNGIGIPEEYQARLFRMFERLNPGNSIPGTGIGLAIIRKAVERMNGSVGVESQPGQGCRFWIQLNRA